METVGSNTAWGIDYFTSSISHREVLYIVTDVSEKRTASIFRITSIVWCVGTNVSEEHIAFIFREEIEAVCSSETLVSTYQTARYHNPKGYFKSNEQFLYNKMHLGGAGLTT
jgi:hypothetical protein